MVVQLGVFAVGGVVDRELLRQWSDGGGQESVLERQAERLAQVDDGCSMGVESGGGPSMESPALRAVRYRSAMRLSMLMS